MCQLIDNTLHANKARSTFLIPNGLTMDFEDIFLFDLYFSFAFENDDQCSFIS